MAPQYIFTMVNLGKVHPPNKEVLKGIYLSFFPGAKIGVLGQNGAGKSTLLRIMAGVEEPTSGEARPAKGIRVGFLPQEPVLDPKKDVRGNIEEGVAEIRGLLDRFNELNIKLGESLSETEMEKVMEEHGRVMAEIEMKNAWELDRTVEIAMDALRVPPGDADVGTLSGGERRRVALCRLLLTRPDLLLLDEPTSGLDPLVQQTFYEVIREAKAEGRTIFLSSHILSEVEKTCDRVAIIRDGQLVKVDRVEALRDLAHHQVELRFTGDVPVGAFAALPGVSDVSTEDHVLRMRVAGSITPVVREAARYELLDFVSREPSLEETFLAQYGRQAGEAA